MRSCAFLFTAFFLVAPLHAGAQTGKTSVTWHGHAAFEIVTPKGQVLMIDPWLTNPKNPNAKDPLAGVERVDYILLTHAHADHVGEAVALAKKTGARLVTNFELGQSLAKLHGYPEKQMGLDTLFNIGGNIDIAGGEVTVAMTPALHSSGLANPGAGEDEPPFAYGGHPAGFVLDIEGGPTIYHTGDTAFFSDMALIGEQHGPDLALINIGGHFGMEPEQAARAAAAVRPKLVVPQHYGTFPVLTQDPAPFRKALEKRKIRYYGMKPGETLVFQGRELVQDQSLKAGKAGAGKSAP